MKRENQPHILNAASNLLGICFILITGLKISGSAADTLADEISMGSALFFLISCLFSYSAMRAESDTHMYERVADCAFIVGVLSLFIAVIAFAFRLL